MHYSAFYVFVPVTFENMDEQPLVYLIRLLLISLVIDVCYGDSCFISFSSSSFLGHLYLES